MEFKNNLKRELETHLNKIPWITCPLIPARLVWELIVQKSIAPLTMYWLKLNGSWYTSVTAQWKYKFTMAR
jgi:hypothetical protein